MPEDQEPFRDPFQELRNRQARLQPERPRPQDTEGTMPGYVIATVTIGIVMLVIAAVLYITS